MNDWKNSWKSYAPFALAILLYACVAAVRASPEAGAREAVKAGALLVDVRTPEEYAAGHIDGAINIPVQSLEARLSEFGPKDRPIVVYCRSGNRSASAKSKLEAAGHGHVLNLGAMSNW